MPRTRSLALSELRIGALTVVALVVTATVIFMLSGEGGFFWQRYSLKTRFAAVPGLTAGAPVRVAGMEAGTVTRIDLVGSQVEVVFELARTMQPRVTTASVASLGSLSLLGQSTVDITPSLQGQPIPEWGYVPSGRAGGQIGEVTASATESLEELTRLLQGLRQGQGTIGRLLTDEGLYREIHSMIAAADVIVTDLKKGRGTAGKLVNDSSVYDTFQSSLKTLNTLLARVEAGEGSLGQLMKDDRFSSSLTSATSSVDAVAGRLNRGEGTAGKLLTEAVLYDRVNSLADRLDQLVSRLDQGQGTAGQLLQDRQLY
jgi:phospholipid/cholesterol/gamma-HCH transport system substrate-binding protein